MMSWRAIPVYVVLLAIFTGAVLPLLWLVLAAFDPAATQATRLPNPSLENFVKVLSPRSFRWMGNSLLIAGVTALVTLVICVVGAYPFSRERFPGKELILYGLLILRVIPVSTFMLPLYILFARLQLINTHLSVILTLTALNLPFTLLLMKGFYDTVPKDFEEAAWVDGAGRVRALFGVLLPQCGPGLAVVFFMTFMNAWNEFLIPLIFLRRTELVPLSVGIFYAFGEHYQIDYGFLSALSFLYALPPVAMYLFIRRNLVKGMAGYLK
jgi:multiple sugar transport system permease protein